MLHRQIILDTETTGMRVEEGHRVIEIGCLEMFDRKLTGKHFHCYINPEREIDAQALTVHGITNEFLQNKPTFSAVAQEFVAFIEGSELIIHNAPFDLSFLNHELLLTQQNLKQISDYCRIVDTLQMARQMHVGQRNSLDALCKRYGIDNSKRDLHGALLDAHLLAQVYLAMTGGQGSFFDGLYDNPSASTKNIVSKSSSFSQKYKLIILKATDEELIDHENYLKKMKAQSKCLWLES